MPDLSTIRILYRCPDLMQLWGIPHEMRTDIGQEPRHLWTAAHKRYEAMSDPSRYRGCGPFGPYVPPDPVAGWVLLDESDPATRAWLAPFAAVVPHGPNEWCRTAMEGK